MPIDSFVIFLVGYRRSEESLGLVRDSHAWSNFFDGWETRNETPSVFTYACSQGNVISILSLPSPPLPFDVADASDQPMSCEQLVAIASMRRRSSGGHRHRLMGPVTKIVKVYSATPVQSAVMCGKVLLGSGSVVVMDADAGSKGRVIFYDNVHAWIVQ
jgi:hypothetical protein